MTFKEALIAHLRGEKVQCMGCEGTWKPLMEKIGEGLIRYVDTQSYMSGLSFRIAPRTILVNGVEVPAGEKEAPSKGATYYVPDQSEESLAYDFLWGDDDMDTRFLERGLVYLDKESAIARAKAMLITQEVK
jgi:hypothetical protein